MTARLVVALTVLLAGPAWASGDGVSANWALSEFGGTPADRAMLYSGNPGVLMGTSPASVLFIGWRRLHGRTVSAEAGEALAVPCCRGTSGGGSPAVTRWLALRKTVPGVAALGEFLPTERDGPDYTSVPNCLDDAFRNAADALQARIAAHGADTAAVRFWVSAEDAVFQACAKPVSSLPPLPEGAPTWLQADYRYQQAALAFYDTDYVGATADFSAIAADPDSPWREIAPYLRMRALLRRALASKSAGDLAAAREAAQGIGAGPLQASAARLDGMIELRADPGAASRRLVEALSAPVLTAQAASDFKDLQAAGATPPPEMLDWIGTIKTGAAAPPVPVESKGTPLEQAQAADGRRVAALGHARERYAATHDVAWMLAALALMQPDDAGDAEFMTTAAGVDAQSPGYLTALYHRLRLGNGAADPAASRALLDGVLARSDLTTTTRNLFAAERLQVAADMADMARFSLRQVVCPGAGESCKFSDWGYSGATGGLLDGPAETATRGLGDDARYLIDRMALGSRIAFGAERGLPAAFRLDVALTNFARAVLLHDDAAADGLAESLQSLLPVMTSDFAAVSQARGADKLFAEYVIFAKVPGLRADLLDYTRPTGAVADFQGGWPNWVVLKQADPDSIAPAASLYDGGSYQVLDVPPCTALGDGRRRIPDAVCDGMCGAGGFVPRLPAFLADTATRATAERRFLPPPGKYGDAGVAPLSRAAAFPDFRNPPTSVVAPAGATYVWEYLLDYAGQHPADKRVPEVLHWLIHIGHFGQSHDHSGKRAFQLLHARYPNSSWAKQNPFYYD